MRRPCLAYRSHSQDETARSAVTGRIVDLGPGAGHDGGRIVFEGTPADLVAARSTLTGVHLAAYTGA
jgi:excinuclease UvrABC ATPase subunit